MADMTRCTYQMIVRSKDNKRYFPIWDCVLESGHNEEHSPGPITADLREHIKHAYFHDGKDHKAKELETVAPGHEVPLEEVLKYSKGGDINRQSIMGKVASRLIDEGWDCRGGRSEKLTWLACATHGQRVTVTGSTIVHNGKEVKEDELWSRLVDMAVSR